MKEKKNQIGNREQYLLFYASKTGGLIGLNDSVHSEFDRIQKRNDGH